MNIEELSITLSKANCSSSVAALKDFKEVLESETCDVCVHGEEKGCKDCFVGKVLGETPY